MIIYGKTWGICVGRGTIVTWGWFEHSGGNLGAFDSKDLSRGGLDPGPGLLAVVAMAGA